MKSSDRLIRCFRLVSLLAGLVSIAAANPAFDQWVDAFTAEWVRAGGGGGGGGKGGKAGREIRGRRRRPTPKARRPKPPRPMIRMMLTLR
jgi:hypothetical protein